MGNQSTSTGRLGKVAGPDSGARRGYPVWGKEKTHSDGTAWPLVHVSGGITASRTGNVTGAIAVVALALLPIVIHFHTRLDGF